MISCFADRLIAAIRDKKSTVIIGLDPHHEQLSEIYPQASLMDAVAFAEIIRQFCLDVIKTVHDLIPAVKVQLALFERLGSSGLAVLEEIVTFAHQQGLLVISDSKRGDIGVIASAYAGYHLGPIPGQKDTHLGGLGADAMTVNPYLGTDTLRPFEPYLKHGKGIWVLARTTNPGASVLQDVTISHSGMQQPLYEYIADIVMQNHKDFSGQYGYSAVGLVVSVKNQQASQRLRRRFPSVFFLLPGIETQGLPLENTSICFNQDGLGAIVSLSRSVLFAYQDSAWGTNDPSTWRDAARWKTQKVRESLSDLITVY